MRNIGLAYNRKLTCRVLTETWKYQQLAACHKTESKINIETIFNPIWQGLKVKVFLILIWHSWKWAAVFRVKLLQIQFWYFGTDTNILEWTQILEWSTYLTNKSLYSGTVNSDSELIYISNVIKQNLEILFRCDSISRLGVWEWVCKWVCIRHFSSVTIVRCYRIYQTIWSFWR